MGDLAYKQPAAVVSAVPEITMRSLDLQEDSFIIIGSDGVWGSIDDAEAVRIVAQCLRNGGNDPVRTAAQQLCEISHQRLNNDDKTAVVVWFGDLPDAPSAVASVPVSSGTTRFPPRHSAGSARETSGDDIFATNKPKAADLSDLDNVFAAYAREIGNS